jgi:hypothetical protein
MNQSHPSAKGDNACGGKKPEFAVWLPEGVKTCRKQLSEDQPHQKQPHDQSVHVLKSCLGDFEIFSQAIERS